MAKHTIICLMLAFGAASSHGLLDKTQKAEKSDIAFEAYLNKTMQEYATWLQDNNLDPAPVIQDSLIIESNAASNPKVLLHCEITNQTISGHSKNDKQTIDVASFFQGHIFAVGRYLREPYWFTGKYNCVGARNTTDQESILFSGAGTYLLHTNTSDETAAFDEVDITEDFIINLNSSKFIYELSLTFSEGRLTGQWNDSQVDENDILHEFQETYKRYLHDPAAYNAVPLHPALPLVQSYLRNSIQNLDLKTIMDPDDLPIIPRTSATTEASTQDSTSSVGVTQTSAQTTTESESSTNWASKPISLGIYFTLIVALVTMLAQPHINK